MRLTPAQPSAQVAPPDSRRTSKKHKRPFPLPLRREHLAWLVVGRHKKLPRDDRGWAYIKVAAEHCPYGPNRRDVLMKWLQSFCAPPSILCQIDAILDRIPPRRWTADALGKHLHVSDFERKALRLWTVGAFDVPKAERMKRRKEKRRLADQARRQARGAKPHKRSISRTKPWETEGISRRTWYRRHPAVAQIRGQYASLLLTTGHESVPPSSVRNGNGVRSAHRNARLAEGISKVGHPRGRLPSSRATRANTATKAPASSARNGKNHPRQGLQRREKGHQGEEHPPSCAATGVHDLVAIGIG
jgi:hypothetical protein